MVLKRIYAIVVFCLFISVGQAQPGTQPQLPAGDPDVVPLTGLEYLVLAGGVYGAHRLSKRKNKSRKKA